MKILFIGIVLLLLLTYFMLFNQTQRSFANIRITINGKNEIIAFFAKSDNEKAKGLMGVSELNDSSGMYFDYANFNKPIKFWMKNMLIPIDIIWIRDDVIVGIEKNVPSESVSSQEVRLYTATAGTNAVLEVKANWCDEHNVRVGDTLKTEITR